MRRPNWTRRCWWIADIFPGEAVPEWFGVAWRNYPRRTTVTARIPINIIMRTAYLIRCWTMLPWGATRFDQQ